MEMKLVTKEQKSILAKLLASENLIVEHGNFSTASFDTKNRVLRLPIWKEMSGSLYDLLVLHEVGHALFTPEEGHHDAKGQGKGFKSFLNVVEDARIERKIKNKFPGGRRSFVDGYKNLMDRDFFGLSKYDIGTLGLIDRINLHYKVGDHVELSFSDEESVFVDRIDKAETWKTVVEICKDLYEYAKENESETDMSDHEWEKVMMEDNEGDEWEDEDDGFDESCDEAGDAGEETGEEESDGPGDNDTTGGESSDEESSKEEDSKDSKKSKEGDSDEDESKKGSPGSGTEGGEDGSFSDYEPESKTDENFRNNEIELVSNEAKPYKYVNIPHDIPLENVIVNFTDLYKDYEDHYARWNELGTSGTNQVEMATEKFNDFRSKNKKIVEYLAKEFEMKKAAKEHSRAATANTGILSSEKLYTYKYNEHIFKKITITPNGKNHGLVMWVDWSGSMSQNMKGTIEQMMILVMFCKRVNIPFEVYAFSDSYNRGENYGCIGVSEDGYLEGKNGIVYGDIIIGRFNLLNLFSSKMRAKQLRDAYIYMTATSEHFTSSYSYGYRRDEYITIPEKMSLGGTPLDHSLIMGFSVMRDFMKRNPVDVINSIYLTDGDSHGCNGMWKVPEEDGRNNRGMFCVRSENVVLRDPISKKQHLCTEDGDRYSRKGLTTNLVRFQREVFDINIVNFFLVQRMKKWDIARMLEDVGRIPRNSDEDLNVTLKKFRKDKYMIIPEGQGFNELYTILGGKHLEVQEEQLEVAEDASVAQMARAFKKFSSGKLEKRKLLSRFIDMVAA
jgi:hypothetical protein